MLTLLPNYCCLSQLKGTRYIDITPESGKINVNSLICLNRLQQHCQISLKQNQIQQTQGWCIYSKLRAGVFTIALSYVIKQRQI